MFRAPALLGFLLAGALACSTDIRTNPEPPLSPDFEVGQIACSAHGATQVTIDFPGAVGTRAQGINNRGDIAGS